MHADFARSNMRGAAANADFAGAACVGQGLCSASVGVSPLTLGPMHRHGMTLRCSCRRNRGCGRLAPCRRTPPVGPHFICSTAAEGRAIANLNHKIYLTKFARPEWLINQCRQEVHVRWLSRKAAAHCRRDRHRHADSPASVRSCKGAIHQAIITSRGNDAYLGESLSWTLLSTYRYKVFKVRKRAFKHSHAQLPTVDHVDDGSTDPEFKICSWRVNDAKLDLLYADFVKLCRLVMQFADGNAESPDAAAL